MILQVVSIVNPPATSVLADITGYHAPIFKSANAPKLSAHEILELLVDTYYDELFLVTQPSVDMCHMDALVNLENSPNDLRGTDLTDFMAAFSDLSEADAVLSVL